MRWVVATSERRRVERSKSQTEAGSVLNQLSGEEKNQSMNSAGSTGKRRKERVRGRERRKDGAKRRRRSGGG